MIITSYAVATQSEEPSFSSHHGLVTLLPELRVGLVYSRGVWCHCRRVWCHCRRVWRPCRRVGLVYSRGVWRN